MERLVHAGSLGGLVAGVPDHLVANRIIGRVVLSPREQPHGGLAGQAAIMLSQFLKQVGAMIEQKVAPVGVSVQQFGFIGAPRVPAVIASAITAKAQAIQEAERARNELATTQAEAAKKIAQADGEAKSLVTIAKGEAEANRIRQSSLTPQLLELRRIENNRLQIEKWNGQLPTVQSGQGGGLILQLPQTK